MTRKIAWVGSKVRTFTNDEGEDEIDYAFENKREIPIWVGSKALTTRIIGKRDGLSRDYVFGGGSSAHSFILEMEDEDAEKLLAMPRTSENFLDVTNAGPDFFEKTYRPLKAFSAVSET